MSRSSRHAPKCGCLDFTSLNFARFGHICYMFKLYKRTTFALVSLMAVTGAWAQTHCGDFTKRLPDLSETLCRDAALQPSGARSVNGMPLYQRDIEAQRPAGDGEHASTKPPLKVLVLGGIHGDEMSSSTLVFRWIALAKSQPAVIDWRFVPVLNPDGMMKTKPTRTNARNVDLNRNFPTPGWNKEAKVYWDNRTNKDPRRWPGPAAQSEPETRFVVDTMDSWKPDLIVSVHAPYAVLDFDGPHTPPQRLGKLFLDRVGIFPGSLGNFGGVNRGVPVVTLELPNANRIPQETEVKQMWVDLLRWADERLVLSRVDDSRASPWPVKYAPAEADLRR